MVKIAWTAPKTFVAEQVLNAADLNTHLRDNLLETAPAKATTDGSIFVVTAANQIAERTPSSARVSTAEATSSTSYVNLATTGPSVTVTTGSKALIMVYCGMSNSTADAGNFMSWDISGATTRVAFDATAVESRSLANDIQRFASIDMIDADLVPGSNTFTAKYKVTSGTGTFRDRLIVVIPF